MNFNQSWNSNRGRSRGNRGCGRGRRGAANMHYRGGPAYHRAVPPLLNTPEPYYNLPRFRGTQESFGHLYCHPLNQEPSWPLVRNRPPYSLNPRQAYLPATRVQPQLSSRSTSPLPGTEEYMQRNICEKSAFLKRELELEGSCLNNALNNFDLSDGDYLSDNTNNNFCNNTYQKADGEEEEEEDKSSPLNENVPSPRRNKKQRQSSEKIMSVEEIHEKIINHISNLSHGKKMNLVNLPGPSGYDIAIQEITRQKRMELSKALRDICNDKFKQTEDSSEVINAIIPDFDIKIEELPRELVQQLSSTLNENVTERIHNMCIDPELMFQQAAEILNNSLDLEKNVVENEIDKVDFSYPSFSGVDEHGRMDLELQNIENSSLNMAIDDSIGQANMLNFENTDQSTPMNFDTTQSLNFNMTAPVNYLDTRSCSSSFDMDFSQNATMNTNPMEDSGLFINKPKPNEDIYSPGHVTHNSSFREISENQNLDNINPAFDLNMIDMHEPVNILLPPSRDEANATSDLLSEEAELAACLAQTDPDSNIINKDSESMKEDVLTAENNDFSAIIRAEDESLLGINESQHRQILKDSEVNPLLKTSASNSENNFDNLPMQDTGTVNFENVLELQDRKKTEENTEPSSFEKSGSNTNSPLRSKDKSDISDKSTDDLKEKANIENVSKAKVDKKKEKKGKSKLKDSESPKKGFEDEQEKRQTDKKSKTKYAEDDISRKSTEKDEFHDRSDRKHWDRYSSGECSKDYTEDDLVERRRQDRRQDDKKPKGKYDDDYYKSDKYDRSKCDSYTESYDDSYRKKYSSIDDDKHRRSDPYHYSKYPIDMEEGRNSKRYYQDKLSSYPHRQDYAYHKYDYSTTSDYYQRPDYSYPSEEYHHSKSHRSKYKKHSKKHKRHRDHSSGSNASSSGSEKNSSTSLSYKTKYAAKPADVCDSPEDTSASRHPKISLKERIQVLCDTKMLNFNPELISPKIVDDLEQNLSADNLKNGPLVNDIPENVVEAPPYEDILVDNIPDIAKGTSDEEDLKGPGEMEALECKKYSQRPWKSPGEKKFMMEHLNQNAPPEEDDGKVEIELNVIDKNEIIEEEICDKQVAVAYYEPSQVPQEEHCVKIESNVLDEKQLDKESEELNQSNVLEGNITDSMEVSSTSETRGLKPEIKELPVTVQEGVNTEICDVVQKKEIEWVTTCTQTDLDKEHSPKKTKKDCVKDKARDSSKEKIKSKQNSFTQTAIVSANAYTQTHKATDLLRHKLIQTDDLKDLQKPETFENIPKSLRRKRCIERMFEIDKEIDKLIKERQVFYNLLSYDSDTEKEPEVPTTTVLDLDEPKQKPGVKERTKTFRETKPLNVETNKQKSIPKQQVAKQPQVSKKKIAEPTSESNEHNAISIQEDSKTKSKLKRGRPKRTQDTPVKEVQKVEEIPPESNKKAHIKEETVKEQTKPKSSSKESSRKRKNKEKGSEEHSKSSKFDMSPSKRHKSEVQLIEKETKPIIEKAIEIKSVESESSETVTVASPTKSRKKEKKSEVEKKIDTLDDVNVEKVAEVSVVEQESVCSAEVVAGPTEEENKDNKLNGSTTSEVVQLPPPIVELPVIEETPTTSVIPEVSNYMKKKKRRLSGLLDYRKKKKKKSKNKNKKLIPVVSSEMFSVKSAVNVTRFSLTQLEEMREEIRSKRVANEIDPYDPNADLPQITGDVDATVSTGSDVVMNENEDVNESKMEVEEREALTESNTYQPQDNVIAFKNINSAILVIKVIDNTVLAASDKGQLLYFDMENGELIETIDVSQTAVTSLVVSKTNEQSLIYSGSLDTRLTFVNFDSKSIIKQETLTEPIQCMESSWGFIFVGSDRGSIIRFDLNLDKVADSLKVSNSNILTIKATQEGPRKVLIVAMRNSAVCVRDAISGLLLRTMQTSYLPTVYTLLIDKNLVYCGTSQHDILVYTFEDGKLAFQHEATKSKGVVCMQIVGNLLLAGCYNGNIYVYNTTNNEYLGTMNGPGGLMLSMEIVKNKVIVGTKSNNFQSWNIPQEFVDQM